VIIEGCEYCRNILYRCNNIYINILIYIHIYIYTHIHIYENSFINPPKTVEKEGRGGKGLKKE
jgi:hypothetical protein